MKQYTNSYASIVCMTLLVMPALLPAAQKKSTKRDPQISTISTSTLPQTPVKDKKAVKNPDHPFKPEQIPPTTQPEQGIQIIKPLELPLETHTIETPADKKKPKSRKDRRSKEPKVKRKTLSQMNYDELKEAKDRALQAKNTESALRYMEKMIPLCSDLAERAGLMLEVADARFTNHAYEEAGGMYKEFTSMYPGHEKITYAEYKTIECTFATVLIAERDQTATKNTLELAQDFLQKYKPGKQYYDDVSKILQTCKQRIFDSELSIIKFYLHRKNIPSVEKRLAKLRESMLSVLPSCEQTLLEAECLLAELKKDTQMLVQKQSELATKFPTNSITLVADNKPKVDYMTKF